MAAKETKHPQTTALPRTLNVTKLAESRGPELEALYSVVSERLNGDFRSNRNKRRRTTGYDNRVGKKRFPKREKEVVDLKKKLPRRIRRKNELRKNEEVGFGVSGDGTKRLRTHVWHAKRFTMSKIWGFHLPLGLHGRGRGSRSIIKSLRDGVVVHDASYCAAVQLEGPEENLLSILSTVLVASSDDSADLSRRIISGVAYGSAMLHHVGATCSHTIAPVTYMWRPHERSEINDVDKGDGFHDAETIENSSAFRLVWIWIHAAAFKEGFDALECASRRENEKAGAYVKCISLEGQLGKVEVLGSKASQLLQKILHPVKSFSQNNMDIKECSANETQDHTQLNFLDFENEDCTSSSIISLVINDPRISTAKAEDQPSVGIQDSNLGPVPSYFRNGESINLWHAASGIYPPFEDSFLCTEKYHQRMALFCLNDKSSSIINEPAKDQCSRVCPVLLLKNNQPKSSIVRWSIILPISWVKTFWIPLVSLGGRAIGLREKHWIACEVGLPYFPSDFPDCNAYSCFMATEATASVRNAELRPPSVRPLSVPTSPPWDIVHYTFNKKKIIGLDHQILPDILSSENMNSVATNSGEECHRPPCCNYGVSFVGLVPRSSCLLARFLSRINNCQLHIFPHIPERKSCISKIMKDKDISNQGLDDAFFLNYDRKLCFIRVLLRAYKDGVFEDGAVVCAPHFSDLTFFSSRSDSNKFELQIPDTLLRSYFVQEPSGKWDLQEPSELVGQESHRWPIGFVTTGFVHGSKKPVAGALCEAVLLARLREEQWNAVPAKRRKKEVYVLVRNLRSTAYRLALAEIVLEQQEQDVEYM